MKIGYASGPTKIPVQSANYGYYLRWYYNGWHYWFFLPGKINLISEGEKYRTIGTRRLSMGTGQMTIAQCRAVRTILNTREVQLFTSDGWKNIRIEPSTIPIDNNFIDGTEFEIVAIIGSKEVSYITGYSPITPPVIVPPKYYGYGALYNWYAVNNAHGLAPAGCHIPTFDEWAAYYDIYDPGGGGKLKETGFVYWNTPNTGATNEYGFNGKGGGLRNIDGSFADLKVTGYYWSSKDWGTDAQMFVLSHNGSSLSAGGYSYKTGGNIRPVKNSTTLEIGQTGSAVDIDGNVYPTICMPDGKEWFASNLKVEHYNDGTRIPNITDNATWAADTEGAMCYYGTNPPPPEPEDETTTIEPSELNWEHDEVDVKTYVVTTAMSRWYFASASSYEGFTVTVWNASNTEQVLDGVFTSGMVVRVNPITTNDGATNLHCYLMVANSSDEIIAGTTMIGTQYAAGYADPPTFDHNPSWGSYPSAWSVGPTASAAWHDESIYITGKPTGFYSGSGTQTMYVWVMKEGVLVSNVLSFGAKDGVGYSQWITMTEQLDTALYQIYYDSVDRSLE